MTLYFVHLLVLIAIFSMLAISMNLSLGFTGLVNLGLAGFFAIGAYTSAILNVRLGLPFWYGLLLGTCAAAACSSLLGLSSLKLTGDYFALATLGFGVIVESVVKSWVTVTGGPVGITSIAKPSIFGIELTSPGANFLLVLFFLLAVYLFIFVLVRSPYGRVLEAIRQDEVLTAALGKYPFRYKMTALVISGCIAGMAGVLFAHYMGFIEPSGFSIIESVLVIAMVIVGGRRSLIGPVVGAAILLLLPELMRFINLPSTMVGPLRQLIYSALLIILIIFRPEGLCGRVSHGSTR